MVILLAKLWIISFNTLIKSPFIQNNGLPVECEEGLHPAEMQHFVGTVEPLTEHRFPKIW